MLLNRTNSIKTYSAKKPDEHVIRLARIIKIYNDNMAFSGILLSPDPNISIRKYFSMSEYTLADIVCDIITPINPKFKYPSIDQPPRKPG